MIMSGFEMSKIWTGDHVSMFYCINGNENPLYAQMCEIVSFDYLSKAGTCSYCGHNIVPGEECPGCAARKTESEKLIAGKANIELVGFLPDSSWMFHNPRRIEAHIRDCGRPDCYDNWTARIVMTNIGIVGQSLSGFEFDFREPIKGKLKLTCDIQVEEHNYFIPKE